MLTLPVQLVQLVIQIRYWASICDICAMEFILLHLFFSKFQFQVAIGSLIGKSLPLHYCSLKDESKYRFSDQFSSQFQRSVNQFRTKPIAAQNHHSVY